MAQKNNRPRQPSRARPPQNPSPQGRAPARGRAGPPGGEAAKRPGGEAAKRQQKTPRNANAMTTTTRGRRVRVSETKVGRNGRVRRRSFLWRWRRLLFLVGLFFVAGIAGGGYVLSQVPLPDESPLEETSFVCASDVAEGCDESNAIAALHAEEDRVNVTLAQVPQVLEDAVIAAEDRDFFTHGGVDPFGIARAAYADIRNQGARQGGSTITQQYVKNVYLTNERTLVRKLKEAVLAVKIEQKLSKPEILERYLNTVYFGRGAYGVQAASQAYFDHSVTDLSLAQAAFLAGLIRAPESAEPTRDPDEATRRRRTVLDAMVEEGYAEPAAAEAADAEPWDETHVRPRVQADQLEMIRGDATGIGAEYYVEYVRKFLAERYGDAAVYGGGLRVYTTVNLGVQRAAYETVTETLDDPDDPDGSIVSLNDQGHILAMMGGQDFATSEVNLAVGTSGGGSGRQPGSTFKTFALAEAIEEGFSVRSVFRAPSQITIPIPGQKPWRVRGGSSAGNADLIQATRNSTNTVFAQLMDELGAESVVELANRVGISAELPEVPSLVLGSGEVSVLDMAAGYSTFANRGERKNPIIVTRVERADGTVLEEFDAETERVLENREADLVTYCLEGVIQGGTGRAAGIGRPAAGKTGTTQDNKDAWFVGYTPQVTTAVWMGYADDPRPMTSVNGREVQGGNIPAAMWQDFMAEITDDLEVQDFKTPGDLGSGSRFNRDLGLSSPDDDDDSDDDQDPSEETSTTTTSTTTAPTSTTTTTTTTAPGRTTTTTVAPSTTSTVPPTTAPPPPGIFDPEDEG